MEAGKTKLVLLEIKWMEFRAEGIKKLSRLKERCAPWWPLVGSPSQSSILRRCLVCKDIS
jgi:hypothetical protein